MINHLWGLSLRNTNTTILHRFHLCQTKCVYHYSRTMTAYIPIVDCISKLPLPTKPIDYPPFQPREREREKKLLTQPRQTGGMFFCLRDGSTASKQIIKTTTTPTVTTNSPHRHENHPSSRTSLVCLSLALYVSFCLMKKDRRWDSCQAQVTPSTTSWIRIHRTTRALVLSDWSRNSASRSCCC